MVIGLDGLDPILLSAWIDELPTFRLMINEGTFGHMRSTIPPLTIPAWATMLTGKRPAKLGNFGLVDVEKDYSLRPVDPARWRGQYVWDLIGATGRRVGVLGVPFLSSPYPVNGFMITDPEWGEVKAFPQEFSTRIRTKKATGSTWRRMRAMWHNIEREKQFVLDILEDGALDFFFFALSATDYSMHWGTRKTLKDAYKKVDDFLSEIIPACKGRQILVVSDHGCKEATAAFNAGTLLAQLGMFRFRDTSVRGPRVKLARTAMSLFFRIPSLRLLLNLIDVNVTHAWRHALVGRHRALLERIDMKEARLFPIPMTCGTWFGMCVNRVNDFDLGRVDAGSEERLLNSLIANISNLRDPASGRSIVKSVLTREDLGYDRSSRFPDLVVQLRDPYTPIFADLSSGTSLHYRELIHSDYGVFLAIGPGIRKQHRLRGLDLADVSPTLLHMLGMPVPDYMDGRVLREIFDTASEFATRDVKHEHKDTLGAGPSLLSKEEENSIAERLKALGYLG